MRRRLNSGEGTQREAFEVMVASLHYIYWVALFYKAHLVGGECTLDGEFLVASGLWLLLVCLSLVGLSKALGLQLLRCALSAW